MARLNKKMIAVLSRSSNGKDFLERAGLTDKKNQKYKNRPVYIAMDASSPTGYRVVPGMDDVREWRKGGGFGFKLDSELEFKHWKMFRGMLQRGEIVCYERQRVFVLWPKFRHPQTGRMQRAITYVADHYWEDKIGRAHV